MSRGGSSRGYNNYNPSFYYYPYNPSMDVSFNTSGYTYSPSYNFGSGVSMEMIQMWVRAQV